MPTTRAAGNTRLHGEIDRLRAQLDALHASPADVMPTDPPATSAR